MGKGYFKLLGQLFVENSFRNSEKTQLQKHIEGKSPIYLVTSGSDPDLMKSPFLFHFKLTSISGVFFHGA